MIYIPKTILYGPTHATYPIKEPPLLKTEYSKVDEFLSESSPIGWLLINTMNLNNIHRVLKNFSHDLKRLHGAWSLTQIISTSVSCHHLLLNLNILFLFLPIAKLNEIPEHRYFLRRGYAGNTKLCSLISIFIKLHWRTQKLAFLGFSCM